MAPTNEYLNVLPSKTITKPIVQLHPVLDEKSAIPDHLRQSIKQWKFELNSWEQESNCLLKMLKWNKPFTNPVRGKLIFNRYEKLIKSDMPSFIEAINDIEKEIFHSLIDDEFEVKVPIVKFQKLEKELKTFKTKIAPAKLEVLKEISKGSPITFF